MPLHNLNPFFGFTLLLGESQNYHHDFLSRLCMLWPQLTSATSYNFIPSHALVFLSHLHCLVLELTLQTSSHLRAFTYLHILLYCGSSVCSSDFLNGQDSIIHYNLFYEKSHFIQSQLVPPTNASLIGFLLNLVIAVWGSNLEM